LKPLVLHASVASLICYYYITLYYKARPNPSQYAIPLTLPDVVEGEETENGEVEREERGRVTAWGIVLIVCNGDAALPYACREDDIRSVVLVNCNYYQRL